MINRRQWLYGAGVLTGTVGLRAGAEENEKPMPGESSPTTSGSMPLTLSHYEPKSAVY